MTRTSFIRTIKIAATAIIIILIVAFAVWRSLNYVRGPKITITEPANGVSITEKSVTVKGRVERATNFLLNGNQTNIDEQGNFSKDIIIFPGINLITLSAKDQFGRSTENRLTLVGNDITSSTSLVR
jgi:hypothetical protein